MSQDPAGRKASSATSPKPSSARAGSFGSDRSARSDDKGKGSSGGGSRSNNNSNSNSNSRDAGRTMEQIKAAERRPEWDNDTQQAKPPMRRVSKTNSSILPSPRPPPASRGVRKTISMDTGMSRTPDRTQANARGAATVSTLTSSSAHETSNTRTKSAANTTPTKPASTSALMSSSASSAAAAAPKPRLARPARSPRSTDKGDLPKKPASTARLLRAAASSSSAKSPPHTTESLSSSTTGKAHAQRFSDEDISIAKQREEKDAVRAKYRTASASSATVTPGAYSVQGQSIQRRVTNLSPQEAALIQTEHDLMSVTSGKYSGGMNRPQQSRGLPPVLEVVPEPSATERGQSAKMVIAAELSSDAEADIAERVRQQLLQSAARADVVTVEHGSAKANRAAVADDVDGAEELKRIAAFKELHRPKGAKERIFGDSRKTNETVDIAATPECIRKRDLLKWTLKRNKATNQWVASVTTNQKALEANDAVEIEKSKCSFTAPTQREAFEIGLSMAVPQLHEYDDNPICFICKAKFALLRRPSHCRNCGICICSNCTVTWPSRMIPETYNTKNISQVKVCLACDWLSSSFFEALLVGKYRTAIDLYKTGNVNLRTPYCKDRNRGNEVCYPVHLAVVGGNLKIVEWLCSEHHCPLRVVGRGRKTGGPLITSKGRSALSIALQDNKLDIARYLIADQGMALTDEKDISTMTIMTNFTRLIQMVPKTLLDGRNDSNRNNNNSSRGNHMSSASSHTKSTGSFGSLDESSTSL